MERVATSISQAFALLWMVSVAYSTAVAEISLGVSLAAVAVAMWRGEFRPGADLTTWSRAAVMLWAAFVGWVLLTHFFALDRTRALGDLDKMYRFLGLLPFVLFPWDRRFRVAFYGSLTGLSIALSIEAIPPYVAQRVGRVEAANLHYNTLAQFSGAISLLLATAAMGEGGVRRGWRIFWGVGAVLGVAVLVCTLSRMAWAAWLTALPVLVMLAVPRRRRWIFLLIAVAMIASALTVPHIRERVQRFTEFDDPEFMRRYDMWDIGEQLIRERPLVGVGPSGVALRYDEMKGGMLVDDDRLWVHLHNDLINIAAYHGIPAALLWVSLAAIMYFLTLRWLSAPRAQRPPPLAVGAALSIHIFFVCGLLHDTLPIYRKFAWYLMLWGLLIHATSRTALEEPDA
jgi:O-antigen ligase